MPVVRPLPQVVDVQLDQTLVRGLAGQRLAQRRQEVREDREVVEPHSSSSSGQRGDEARAVGDHDPAAGDVDLGHQRLHERHQRLPAVRGRDPEQVLGAAVHEAGDGAERRAVLVVRREVDQLVVVELVGVVRRRVGRDRGVQDDPAGGLGRGAVGQLLEGDAAAPSRAAATRPPSGCAETTPSPAGARRAACCRARTSARARRCVRRR